MILTRETLDTARCANPECEDDHGPLYFHSKCHPDSPTWSYYEDGKLTVECAVCRKTIATVEVST